MIKEIFSCDVCRDEFAPAMLYAFEFESTKAHTFRSPGPSEKCHRHMCGKCLIGLVNFARTRLTLLEKQQAEL